MSIERVHAVVATPGTLQRQRGETVPSVLRQPATAVEGGQRRPEGAATRWRPDAGGEPQQRLQSGDVVQVRVVATQPRLELELLPDLPLPAAKPLPGDVRSMRLDQAALYQVHWHMPDAHALATVWRVLLRAHAPQHAAGALPAPPTPQAGDDAPMPSVGRELALPAAVMRDALVAMDASSRWVFPVFAWGGMHVTLRLRVSGEPESPGGRQRRRDPANTVLEVVLRLPGLGPVLIRLQWGGHGVWVSVVPEERSSAVQLEAVWPELRAALSRCPWPVQGCRLELQAGSVGSMPHHDDRPVVSPALLGVAAELVSFLARQWPAQPGRIAGQVVDPSGSSPGNPQY
ncbi:hypothetical protein [Hydrogenophaga aquatica]